MGCVDAVFPTAGHQLYWTHCVLYARSRHPTSVYTEMRKQLWSRDSVAWWHWNSWKMPNLDKYIDEISVGTGTEWVAALSCLRTY